MINDSHVDQNLNIQENAFFCDSYCSYEVEDIATTAEKINLHNALTRVVYFFCMNPK